MNPINYVADAAQSWATTVLPSPPPHRANILCLTFQAFWMLILWQGFKNEFEQGAHLLCLTTFDGAQIEIQMPLGRVGTLLILLHGTQRQTSVCEFAVRLVSNKQVQMPCYLSPPVPVQGSFPSPPHSFSHSSALPSPSLIEHYLSCHIQGLSDV